MDLFRKLSTWIWEFGDEFVLNSALRAAMDYFPGAIFTPSGTTLQYAPTGSLQYDLVVAGFLKSYGGMFNS